MAHALLPHNAISTEIAQKVFLKFGEEKFIATHANREYPTFQYYVHKFLKEKVLIRHQRGTPHQSAIYQFSPKAVMVMRRRLN